MRKIDIQREDVLKVIYFITAITQSQNSGSMQGALSSKGDLMGGIFDRWINLIPENLIFNKILLPSVKGGENTRIITDFYLYDPKKAGIAPDVIGIETNGKSIPFAVFSNGWNAVEGKPQIEVKTFKESQYMVSLRNQHYDGKYLVMAETNLRIDYLLPFFSEDIFQRTVFEQLRMDDSVFIKDNSDNLIAPAFEINRSNSSLGTVSLLKVTDVEAFKTISLCCGAHTSVRYIKSITEAKRGPNKKEIKRVPLSEMCISHPSEIECLYRFNADDSNCLTLDISANNINDVTVLKEAEKVMYVEVSSEASINGYALQPEKIYKIEMDVLNRNSKKGEEYFLQKNLVSFLIDKEKELISNLETIIEREKNI